MHGAAYVVDALARERTTHLFMVPGGLNDPFMEPMTSTDGVTTVVAAFEGGAAYMADGWGRASYTQKLWMTPRTKAAYLPG